MLATFQSYLNLLDSVSKNTETSNFVKIRSVGVKLFHADRQTDRQMDGWIHRHDKANSHYLQLRECA